MFERQVSYHEMPRGYFYSYCLSRIRGKAIRHLIFQLSDDIFKLYLKQGSKTYIMVNTICVKKYLKENDPWIKCTTLLNKQKDFTCQSNHLHNQSSFAN